MMPERAKMAIIFGIAIRPLKISAMVHTADTVIYGPINTAIIYRILNDVTTHGLSG